MPRRQPTTLSVEMDSMRADYQAAKRTSRFQRRRRGVPTMGAGADYHYASEADYLWMQEAARDMYRNDVVVGQITDRAVVNTIGSGFTPDPDTGDKKVDKDLKDRWLEECQDPDYCDAAGELTFHEQEKTVLRDMLVAGDIFGLPTPDGTVQLVESHRCRSPHRTKKNMVHGVELEKSTRRRQRFWFTRESIDPLKAASSIGLKDLTSVPARDDEGEALVWHVYNPKRATQTRGVTAYAPVFSVAGMHDDLEFAQLLKAQLNAMWLLVRERDKTFFDGNPVMQPLGPTSDSFVGTRRAEELAPGSEIALGAGEKVQPWSPNTPSAEFFPHVRLVLTFIGINIGMPLVLVLMDAEATNFSGFRGAVDQARIGFRDNQRLLKVRWHTPYWRFKANYWADEDPVLAAAREQLGPAYLRHRWQVSGWPYIEPMKDAQADLIRASNMQTSHRRICAERGGMEWPDVVAEVVEDRRLAIETALEVAKKINSTHQLQAGDVVSWRDLAPLPTPERVSVFLGEAGETSGESDAEAQPKPKAKPKTGGKRPAA